MVSEETSPGPEAWPGETEGSVGQGCGAAVSSEVSLQEEGRGSRLAGGGMRRQRGLGEGDRGRGHSSVSAAQHPPPPTPAPDG